MTSTANTTPVIGIDVGKEQLDLAIFGQQAVRQWKNEPASHQALGMWVTELEPELVVLEASGGYEAAIASHLVDLGLPVAVVNPTRIRAFAKAAGQLAKTDQLDARLIAHFGATMEPTPNQMPSESQRLLKNLVTRRRQLVDMTTAEKNRLALATQACKSSLESHLAWLAQELDHIAQQISQLIQDNPLWRATTKLIESVPGVGRVTAHTLIATMPELGQCNRQQIAALAGLAPFNRDSSTYQGKRHIFGGRAAVRSGLYMATLSATRCNPVIRTFYQRLLEAGKPTKVALTACMRKLLTIINAIVRSQTPWHYQKP